MKITLIKNVKYSGVFYTEGQVTQIDDDFLVKNGFAIPVIEPKVEQETTNTTPVEQPPAQPQVVEAELKVEEKKTELPQAVPAQPPVVVEPTISTMPPIVEASQKEVEQTPQVPVTEPQTVEDESKKKEIHPENSQAMPDPQSPPVESIGVSTEPAKPVEQPEGSVAPAKPTQEDNPKLKEILEKLKG